MTGIWTGDKNAPLVDRWVHRRHFCDKFQEVLQLLDELGCPPTNDVGMLHVRWRTPGARPGDQDLAMVFMNYHGDPEAIFRVEGCVPPKSLGSRGILTRAGRFEWAATPETLRDASEFFIEELKAALEALNE